MTRSFPTSMLLILLLALSVVATGAEAPPSGPSEPSLVRQPYTSSTDEACEYLVYLPRGYDSESGRRWPVLYFLHGDGERGDAGEDLDWVLVHGPLYEAWIQKRDLPFIIVSPQLPLFGRDETVDYIRDRTFDQIPQRLEVGVPPRAEEFPTPFPMDGAVAEADLPFGAQGPPDGWNRREADLLAILDLTLSSFRADGRRVYLTGISYGGFGSWYLASRHPERFAAVAPVVGWGHPDLMPALAERPVPIWVFAGGRDTGVPVRFFYPGLEALEAAGHGEVRFTIHADTGHDAWRRVYAGRDLYGWLLRQALPPR